MKVFAILHEPASYTQDRNKAVYDKLGVRYEYMHKGAYAAEFDGCNVVLPSKFCSLFKRLKQILAENDVVIMNGYSNRVFIILFLLNIFSRKPIGIDSDTQLTIPSNPIKRFFKWFYLRLIFGNSCIYGLAGGNVTHKELFRHYGMKDNHIFLMPMMVKNEKFFKSDDRVRDTFNFLYVGRVVECKNIELLLKAFVNTFKTDTNVCLDIVGDGELLPYFQQTYGKYKNVIFSGKCLGESLVKKYHSADAFILPSAYEPWGLVVNEALSSGLPVIVSDQVGARFDLVEGKDTGFVFKWDDAEDLQEKMLKLKEDCEMHERFSKNAVALMRDHWNYDLYLSCLNNFINYATDKNNN